MSDTLELTQKDIRKAIKANPELILNDPEILQHLLESHNQASAGNVVNFQSVMIDRLRERLSIAEEDHRSLLEIAISNMHALDQIHEACVAMLEADSAVDFVTAIQKKLPKILGTEYANLAVERQSSLTPFENAVVVESGALGFYFELGGTLPVHGSHGKVVLRKSFPEADILYADCAKRYQSEALVMLNLGARNRPALLFFADTDPERFTPSQSAELLSFMGRIAELIVQKWQTYN